MFTVDCPRHQTRVLLGSRAIDAMVNTEHGVEIHWTCHCGATGTTPAAASTVTTHTTRKVAA